MSTFYINADTGDDGAGDGSSGNPWETLAKAHTEAASDDTIVCQTSVANYAFANQTFTKALTIQGQLDDGSGAVFDGADAAREWLFPTTLALVFEKMTIQNVATQYFLKGNNEVNATFNDFVFRNIYINNTPASRGFWGAGGNIAANVIFNRVLFFDLQRAGATRAIFSMSETGTHICTMDNCSFFISAANPNPPANIFKDEAGSPSLTVKNSIFSNENAAPMDLGLGGSIVDGDFTYSCFNNIVGPSTNTGNISSDPLFVDVANENFNLRPTSPCINTGTLI